MKWISILAIFCALHVTVETAADGTRVARPSKQRIPATGPYGGRIQTVDDLKCEVVFRPRHIRVYLYDLKGKPVSARRCRGTVSLQVDGRAKRFRFDLYPESTRGADDNCLFLAVDLSRIKNGTMQSSFSIVGVTQTSATVLAFSQSFQLTPTLEAQAIARQQICLVSGKTLGSMGQPIKTTVNGRAVYVCCVGCKRPLLANPAKYLARLKNPARRPVKATKSDATAIAQPKLDPSERR